MDNVVDRDVPFADENIDPTSRPAENAYEGWEDSVDETIKDPKEDLSKLTPQERAKRIKEMDQIIKNEI